MNHSYSSLTLFDQCPHAWYLRNVMKEMQPPTEPQAFGTAVHAVIEGMFKGVPIGAAVEHAVQAAPLPLDASAVLTASVCPEVVYGENRHAEEWSRVPLPGCSWPLIAKLDLWWQEGGTAHIYDWKTGSSRRHDLRQLALYAYALLADRTIDTVDAHLYYTREQTDIARAYTRQSVQKAVLWAAQTGARCEQMYAAYGKSSDFHFPEQYGVQCQYCTGSEVCYQNVEAA